MTDKFLTVDGMLSGTGIRMSNGGGYIDLAELGLSDGLVRDMAQWLEEYENAHYDQYENEETNERLDRQGIALAKRLRGELSDADVSYFSSAKMQRIPIE